MNWRSSNVVLNIAAENSIVLLNIPLETMIFCFHDYLMTVNVKSTTFILYIIMTLEMYLAYIYF